MNIFNRLLKIFQAKANVMINNLGDPVDIIEHQLEAMKENLSKNIDYLRKVKALAIRVKNDNEEYILNAKTHENKAIDVLTKVKLNEISIDEADRLAKEALLKKEELLAKIKYTRTEQDRLDYKVELLKGTINVIKSNIFDWENELKLLKLEIKLEEAEQNKNKRITHIDNDVIESKLELIKEKIAEYQQLNKQIEDPQNESINLDEDIDFTMDSKTSLAKEELKKLKEQLGIKQ